MGKTDLFKITYIGGGSRFVLTLLHGLAAQADALKALKRPIELALMDPKTDRADEMARYAEITARQTGLVIAPGVTADRDRALEGSDWVILSAALYDDVRAARKRFAAPLGDPHGESGPGAAIEAAALWPFHRRLAADMRRLCPRAVFGTLVNPTDVLAGAFQKAFGIPSVGICVEAPQLLSWLSHQMQVNRGDIRIEQIGLNHVGWVSRWTIAGRDGTPLLRERLPDCMRRDTWDPTNDEFAWIFLQTGYMRSSPYHSWPYFKDRSAEEHRLRYERYRASRPYRNWDAFCDEKLHKALAEGRMIEEHDLGVVRQWDMPYKYCSTRHTLGALAVGQAGGQAGPVPLQVPNGRSNPALPPDVWVEVPAIIRSGEFLPQTVSPPPNWLFNHVVTLGLQRALLADWLSGKDPQALGSALLSWPSAARTDLLLQLARELPELLEGGTSP